MQVGDIVVLGNRTWGFVNRIFTLAPYDNDTTAFNIDGFRWDVVELRNQLREEDKIIRGSSLARRLLCK